MVILGFKELKDERSQAIASGQQSDPSDWDVLSRIILHLIPYGSDASPLASAGVFSK